MDKWTPKLGVVDSIILKSKYMTFLRQLFDNKSVYIYIWNKAEKSEIKLGR